MELRTTTAAGLMAGWALVAGCQDTPAGPPRPGTTTVPAAATPSDGSHAATGQLTTAEPSDAPLPPHQYRGVAGFRMSVDGQCPPNYEPVHDVCAHRRLIAAESPAALAQALRAFIGGAIAPIVADAPPGEPRDPGTMDPGALQPTGSELQRQAEARALLALHEGRQSDRRSGEPVAAAVAPQGAVATTTDGPDQAALEPERLLGLFGAFGPAPGQAQTPGQAPAPTALPASPEAVKMLQDLQQMTDDGEVDMQEASRMFDMLRTQLQDPQLPPELLPTPRGAGR